MQYMYVFKMVKKNWYKYILDKKSQKIRKKLLLEKCMLRNRE